MPAVDVDVTYQRRPLDLERDRPTITRTGADIRMPLCEFGKNLAYLSGSAEEADRLLLTWRYSPWLKLVLSSSVKNVSRRGMAARRRDVG